MKSKNSLTVLKNIFEKSADTFLLVVNHKGVVVYANKLFLDRLKLTPEENYLANLINDFNDLINPIEIEKLKLVLKTKKRIVFETFVENKNYKFIVTPHFNSENKMEFISLVGSLFQNEEESVVELKSTISSQNKKNSDLLELIEKLSLQNIELTKSNDSLNEELTNKDKFFSILSHDLRGQMGNMINSSDLLVESFDKLDDTDKKSIIEILNKTIRKNYVLLDNLLLWASFERGKINLNFENVNVRETINNALKSLKNEVLKKKIVVINSVENDITASSDLKFLELILKNIISNAIKFSYSKGKVEISNVIIDNQFSEIVITDYGIGMNDATLNGLFKIDNIHSNYGTEKETGNGMGLLVANRIIEEMEGKLTIISELNKGTIVRISYQRS